MKTYKQGIGIGKFYAPAALFPIKMAPNTNRIGDSVTQSQCGHCGLVKGLAFAGNRTPAVKLIAIPGLRSLVYLATHFQLYKLKSGGRNVANDAMERWDQISTSHLLRRSEKPHVRLFGIAALRTENQSPDGNCRI
jgi:hypothetical protein